MQTYIVRQPILNARSETIGYEILYQDDADSLGDQKEAMAANAIEDFLLQFNQDKLLEDKLAFITFTSNLIMKNVPKIFSTDKLIIQIEDNVISHPLAQKIIHRYKKQGYTLAVKNFEFLPRYFAVLDIVDIIKIDFANLPADTVKNIVSIGRNFKKEVVAYNINDTRSYNLAKELCCDYMQGAAVAEQNFCRVSRVQHIQGNFIQLMIEVTKDEPDIDEISRIISRDVTLAFSLIKLVNSAYFALRSKAKSVKQALMILGLGQLKKWIYLLSFKQNDQSVPEELIKISFLRATFCSELLDYTKNLPISKSEAYLMGMFSTLGVLMNTPIEEALNELFISDEVKNALIGGKGRTGLLYSLVLSYEKADWAKISYYSGELGIPINILTQKYFECIELVNDIWAQLMYSQNDDDESFQQEFKQQIKDSGI